MEKYEIEIDVTKIQKDRLVKNTYKNKEGVEVTQTLLKATVILNKNNVIKDYDDRTWKERGFVVESGKKDDKTNILGKVTQTVWKGESSTNDSLANEFNQELDPSNLPF